MARGPASGAEAMRALALDTPRALERGFANGLETPFRHRGDRARVVAVGMGGSGIAADLARTVVEAETDADLSVVRGAVLPRAVGPRTHVLLTSYSGNTWETLSAYESAGRQRAERVVITSGGELAERADADGVPVLRIPPGLPPRSAVGHLLGGTLGLLDRLFPESNERRVARVAETVERTAASYGSRAGPPVALARRLGDRLPFVYADTSFVPLARRWKTQIEENAKRLAVFDELPEVLHNALVGWDAARGPTARRNAVVLLEWAGLDPRLARSFRYFERVLRARRVRVESVPLPSEDRLEALVGGVVLGDLVSLELARRRSIDPRPVDAIVRLKAHQARGSAR